MAQPQAQAQHQQQSSGDGKAYYGYLFQADKQPTKVLDALLRGVANYICENIGDREEKCLTPAKMAGFYKAVGGNYDSLFVSVPSPSISWIYASIGCQHTLQPIPTNDYLPPSIPALTTRGFVRWQSIEILLGPEEHVPFLQTAVRDFPILNPEDGTRFPSSLPADAFPLVPDREVEKWHRLCAERLRRRATPSGDEDDSHDDGTGLGAERGPNLQPRPRPIPRQKTAAQAAYVRVRPAPRTARTDADYFEQKSRAGMGRPLGFQHVEVPVAGGDAGRPLRPKLSHSPSHRARQFLAPEDTTRGRRRSLPDNASAASAPSSPKLSPAVPGPVPRNPGAAPQRDDGSTGRRHSHPRHGRRGSVSSDASSEDDEPSSPSRRRTSHPHPSVNVADIMSSIRFAVPPGSPKMGQGNDRRRDEERRRERDEDRYGGWETHLKRERARREREEEDTKRRSTTTAFGIPIPIDLSGRLSRQFLGTGNKKDGGGSRSGSKGAEGRGANGNGSVKWKDLGSVQAQEAWRRSGERGSRSEEDDKRYRDPIPVRPPGRDDRDRDRDRDSGGSSRSDHKRRERDRERERERSRERDRERARERERERERHREGDPPRPRFQRRGSSLEDFSRRERERERDEERERARERERERRALSPARGINGRRYPSVGVDGGR